MTHTAAGGHVALDRRPARWALMRSSLNGWARCACIVLALQLAACSWWVPSAPLQQQHFAAAKQPADTLVIVLPGLGEDMADLQRSGMAAAIQRGLPNADVTYALASLRYY